MLNVLQEKRNKILQSAEAAIVRCCPKGFLWPTVLLGKAILKVYAGAFYRHTDQL